MQPATRHPLPGVRFTCVLARPRIHENDLDPISSPLIHVLLDKCRGIRNITKLPTFDAVAIT
jgi:hypothetical protein